MPLVYRCPSDRSGNLSTWTSYVAVIGPETAWLGEQPRRISDFHAASNTILLVEMENSGIHWMEPHDLSLQQALGGTNPHGKKGICSGHISEWGYFVTQRHAGVNMAFVDGSVHYLREGFPWEMLNRLFSVAGAGTTDVDVPPVRSRPRRDHIIGLSVLVVSYLFLLLRPRRERLEPRGQ
ncbi:MAG TPA: hypothetical protein EYH34_15075 [Planctomycetes bacterium]|nr:hypothetical protein [Planctomycetota bacterium]